MKEYVPKFLLIFAIQKVENFHSFLQQIFFIKSEWSFWYKRVLSDPLNTWDYFEPNLNLVFHMRVLPIKTASNAVCRLLRNKFSSWAYFCVHPIFHLGDIVKKSLLGVIQRLQTYMDELCLLFPFMRLTFSIFLSNLKVINMSCKVYWSKILL